MHQKTLKRIKDNTQNKRRYSQVMYLIMDYYPEYMKNPYNSATKTTTKTISEYAKDLRDISPEKICKWPMNSRKDTQYLQS